MRFAALLRFAASPSRRGNLAVAGFAPGCKKDKESLILVEMQAIDANAGTLIDVAITVSESTGGQVAAPIFDLSAGIPMTPDSLTYGVYIPAGVTGTLTVGVKARPAAGCNGYLGTKSVKVVGGDSPPVKVILKAGDTCGGNTTGTAGTSGTAGTTGTGGGFGGSSGGAGGSSGGSNGTVCGVTSVGTPVPPVTTAPTLTNCTYIDQLGSGVTCDTAADTNNPIVYKVSVSPDGQFMVTSGWSYFSDDVSMKIWRFQNGTPVLCGPEYTAAGIGPAYTAFSPDSKYLAVALRNGYVDVFSLPDLKYTAEIKSAPGTIWGVGFSPDSQTVFTIDYDSTITDGHLYADRVDGTRDHLVPAGCRSRCARGVAGGERRHHDPRGRRLPRHRRRLHLQRQHVLDELDHDDVVGCEVVGDRLLPRRAAAGVRRR